MDFPIISVCCITYNHVSYIRQCLDGILMQRTTYPFEIIINDDCSTDGTTEIIKEYVSKYPDIIVPIFHGENQYQKGVRGIYAKFVFPKARGKYIALCEGDDYWIDPLKLQKQVDFLEKNPEYGMCYTKSIAYFQESKRFGKSFGGELPNTFSAFLYENRVPTQSVVYKRTLYTEYKEEIGYHPEWQMGDYPIYLWFTVKSKVYFLPEVTSVYRCLKNSASHFTNRTDWIRFRINAFEISKYFADHFAPELLYIPESRLLWLHYELAIFDPVERNHLYALRKEIKRRHLIPSSRWEYILLKLGFFPILVILLFRLRSLSRIAFL
jgi:glycosyltransferase involved in cell wall biosynthesis